MTTAIQRLPDAQEQALMRAYAQAIAARRARTALGAVILVVLVVLSARTSEVDIGTFVARIGSVGDYFDRLSRLAPELVVTAELEPGGGQFLLVLRAG